MKLYSLILLILLMSLVADASSFMKVTEIPDIRVNTSDTTNFTVTVQNLGNEGSYARLLFRGEPPGLWIAPDPIAKYIYQGGKAAINVTLGAGNVSPGTYSMEVGISAKGSPLNYREFTVIVEEPVPQEKIYGSSVTENLTGGELIGSKNDTSGTVSGEGNEIPVVEDKSGREDQSSQPSPGLPLIWVIIALIFTRKLVFRGHLGR